MKLPRLARIAASSASLAALVVLAVPAFGQAPEGAVTRIPDDLEWTEIVPGVSFGAVYGMWSEEGHAKLIRFDPGIESPVHTHTHGYHAVVVSGTVANPYPGEESPPRMGPGEYFYVPGGAPHVTSCVSEEPCLFYTHADAAWDIQPVEGS